MDWNDRSWNEKDLLKECMYKGKCEILKIILRFWNRLREWENYLWMER